MDGVGLIGTVVGTQKRIEIGEYLSYVRHTDTTSNDTKKKYENISRVRRCALGMVLQTGTQG